MQMLLRSVQVPNIDKIHFNYYRYLYLLVIITSVNNSCGIFTEERGYKGDIYPP